MPTQAASGGTSLGLRQQKTLRHWCILERVNEGISMSVINVDTTDDFKKHVLENSKVVLVDFWAPWCAPCLHMSPILESIAKKMDQQVDIVKVNIESNDQASRLAAEYGVRGIPNMQVFKSGNVVDQLVGMRPQTVLEEELTQHVA